MSTFDWLKRAEAAQPGSGAATERLKERVIDALHTVFDPEIPVNIYDLGLVYGLDVDEAEGRVEVRMTLTAPGCPVAQTFPATVEDAVFSVDGVNDVHVELVWDPPWSRARMSDAARLQLGMF
jgi:FeS assembly SUF system protein